MRTLRHLLPAALLLWACACLAQTVPTQLAGVTVVSPEEAQRLAAHGAIIVDTRSAYEYVEQHIRGAVSLPYKEMSAKTPGFDARVDHFPLQKLRASKDSPIVFYCNGPECWKSYKASATAVRAGYKRVYWLRDGMPGWRAHALPVE